MKLANTLIKDLAKFVDILFILGGNKQALEILPMSSC